MIKKIIGTVGSRGLIALINLLITACVIRYLGGAEAAGTIALIVLGITIVLLLCNIAVGSPIVYLSSRVPLPSLLLPSYLWIIITAFVFLGIFSLLPFLVPEQYMVDIILIASLEAGFSLHLNILVGKERIKEFNTLFVLRSLVLLISILIQIFYLQNNSVDVYINAVYISNSVCLLLSFLTIFSQLKGPLVFEIRLVKQLFKYGIMTQFGNLLQLGNYRLAYYLIELYLGRFALGIYSIATMIAEGAWLPGKSLAVLQLSRIANTKEKSEQRLFTLTMLKLSVLVTTFLMLIILFIPSSVFQFIFTNEVEGIRRILLILSPGIVIFSFQFIISHYYSGNAKYGLNTLNTAVGLVATLIFALILIPNYGLNGAAAAVSLSFITQTLFLTLLFFIEQKIRMSELMVNDSDVKRLKTAIGNFKSRLS